VRRYTYPTLLAALVVAVYAPLVLHPNSLVYPRGGQATDLTITHWPAVAFDVETLHRHGQVPLWRTTIASGGPWMANPQSWLLYPPAWLFFVPGVPIHVTFNLLIVAHLLLAALATYTLGRRALGLTPMGSALAGLAFALAPWNSAQLAAGHVNVVLALAWLPVALLGAQRLATTGHLGSAALIGTAWAAALLNHYQMAAFVAALTVAWSLWAAGRAPAWWRRRQTGNEAPDPSARPRTSAGRVAGLLLLACAIALLLSAALLVPLFEALPYLTRRAVTPDEAGIFSLSWAQLLTALIPTYGGEPEQAIYLGLPLVWLAALGLGLRRDRIAWFWAIGSGVAILFALGTHGPLYPLLIQVVPGLNWLRVPPRAWMVVSLGVAVLAGRGLDRLAQPHLSIVARRRATMLGLAALVAGLALAGGLALLYRPVPSAVWVLAMLSGLMFSVLLLRTRLMIAPGVFALTVVILAGADLAVVRTAWIEMRTAADAFAWGAEAAAYLAEKEGQFRVYSPSYSLPQHTAFEYGLSLADGVDPFQLAHYADLLAVAGGFEPGGYSVTQPPRLYDPSAQPDARRLGLLNVGYVASSFPIEAGEFVLEAHLGETYLYRNEAMLPRAFVVAGPRTSGPITLGHSQDVAPARVAVYTPNRIVVEVDVAEPGLLVLSEVWYPGWQALDNGIEVPIQQVEGILRGVYVQTGSHTVEFRYAPWTVWCGLAISGSTALVLVVCAASRWWRRA
jgi:hypothetical protein